MVPPRLSESEIQAALPSEWSFAHSRISRTFRFVDFPAALAFMVRVGFTCEAMNHHPNWSNVYATLKVELWTHDADGITRLDIDLATHMNDVFSQDPRAASSGNTPA